MSDARIADRGYRRYEGQRAGVRAALTSLALHTARRLLGLRRSLRYKLVPIAVLVIAFGASAVVLGMAALLPDVVLEQVLPSVGVFLGFLGTLITLFAALISPQALCPDRRERMLGLYLSSPLDRDTYLLGKFLAVTGVMLTVTLGPSLVVVIGYLSLDVPIDVPVIGTVAAALLVAAYLALIGLAVSSLTERTTAAAAGLVLGTFLLAVAGRALELAGAPGWVRLLSVAGTPLEAARRLAGGEATVDAPDVAVALAVVGWAAGAAVLLRTRYQRLEVTR